MIRKKNVVPETPPVENHLVYRNLDKSERV